MYRIPWLALSVLVPISSGAVEIYDRFPGSIHASERYVIYSHGMIVEGDDSGSMIFRRSSSLCFAQRASI
jgi:hypothetical protein